MDRRAFPCRRSINFDRKPSPLLWPSQRTVFVSPAASLEFGPAFTTTISFQMESVSKRRAQKARGREYWFSMLQGVLY